MSTQKQLQKPKTILTAKCSVCATELGQRFEVCDYCDKKICSKCFEKDGKDGIVCKSCQDKMLECYECGRQCEHDDLNECTTCGDLFCDSCIDSHGCTN